MSVNDREYLRSMALGFCTWQGCTSPQRHHVTHGETATGAVLCCSHLDDVMLELAHVEDGNGADGEAGLRSFVAAHRSECGPKVATDLFTRYRAAARATTKGA